MSDTRCELSKLTAQQIKENLIILLRGPNVYDNITQLFSYFFKYSLSNIVPGDNVFVFLELMNQNEIINLIIKNPTLDTQICFFLTDANILSEGLFGFRVTGTLSLHTFSVFGWMPSIHFFLCLVSWPFIQKFIHQRLHRRWVLNGGFERQKKFMDRATRFHNSRLKADLADEVTVLRKHGGKTAKELKAEGKQ